MRRSLVLASICAIISVQFAAAADLPTKAPAQSVVTAPLYDWTGFYFGGHISESWAKNNSTTINTVTGAVVDSGGTNRSGFHGGGQIGYDYMMPSRFVIGVLADVSSGTSRSTSFSNHTDNAKTDASGTVRGRLGYAFNNVLLYAAGGWAWTTGTATRTQTGLPLTGATTVGTVESVSANRSGWTVGTGLAWAFLPNWNVFGEYRYTDYGSNTLTFPIAQRSTTGSTTANLIELGVNYKF